MAGGLVAWGDDRVTRDGGPRRAGPATRSIEPRRDDPAPGRRPRRRPRRRRDRLARSARTTCSTRSLVATIPVPGAPGRRRSTTTGYRLFVGDRRRRDLDDRRERRSTRVTSARSSRRSSPHARGVRPGRRRGSASSSSRRDGGALLVETTDDRLITLDADIGREFGARSSSKAIRRLRARRHGAGRRDAARRGRGPGGRGGGPRRDPRRRRGDLRGAADGDRATATIVARIGGRRPAGERPDARSTTGGWPA